MAQIKPRNVVAGFRFKVELDGIQVAGFSEVSGLQAEIEYEEYQEGGVNIFVHRFPKHTKYPALVLKRGVSNGDELWKWFLDTRDGKISKKSGAVIMYDKKDHELCRWTFVNAYPVKWGGPELNANQSSLAIETIELVHQGIKFIKGK
ncbi:phage tail-like protein [Tumebacillus sp. BK434]|uniref:phage tail protein n=1 Tax=Tumebacillus sp. BK434 TaxID=2512169 RepID=UPI00104A3584|nr:phage tail protein [Tumebacillus sp. BK434]TCP59001.1 phage tail-like protein [Tumebacillus sp. BK434]